MILISAANANKSFQGSLFVVWDFARAGRSKALIDDDQEMRDVVLPYLNGQDLNSNPESVCPADGYKLDWSNEHGRWREKATSSRYPDIAMRIL